MTITQAAIYTALFVGFVAVCVFVFRWRWIVTVTVTINEGLYFRPGDVVRVSTTGEDLEIISVSASNIVSTRIVKEDS